MDSNSGLQFSKFPILLFDLGGVLVQWDGVPALLELTSQRLSPEQARRFWLTSRWVRLFEKGECSPAEFAQGAVDELKIDLPPDEFLAAFISWDRGPLPGAKEILEDLKKDFHLACLSNNNVLHWPKIRDQFGFGRYFEKSFLSHEIGLIKPDPAIFDHVVNELDVRPQQILFFDDNIECVEGARAKGLQAELTRGVAQVRQVIGRIRAGQPAHT